MAELNFMVTEEDMLELRQQVLDSEAKTDIVKLNLKDEVRELKNKVMHQGNEIKMLKGDVEVVRANAAEEIRILKAKVEALMGVENGSSVPACM